MKETHALNICKIRRASTAVTLAALLWSGLIPSALAGERYLTPGHPDGIALLAPPPAPGSAEAAADLEMARAVFKARTPAESAHAKRSAGLSFSLFEPAIGPVFQLDKLPRTEALLKKVKSEIHDPIYKAKDYWKRVRPCNVDTNLTWGPPEESFSYPSGHSTAGTVYGLVLSEIFPDKKDAIMEIGYGIGWDRVLIGKHYLTDVRAGRVLAQAIVREMLANPSFQADLAAVRAEVQAAQQAGGQVQTAQPARQ